MNRVLELFGVPAERLASKGLQKLVNAAHCPFLDRRCLKNRKSDPNVLIGTCVVANGKKHDPVIICPHRLLERRKIFIDAFHLLTLHEPGNDLHIVPEISLPGGSVDYFVVSVRNNKIKDFVGVELQTLDTTGTVWPERQRLLHANGLHVRKTDVDCKDKFSMNWKMTAKTILIQLHHKVQTFEHLGKKLLLVIQDQLLDYMERRFTLSHLTEPTRFGDSMHIHAYRLARSDGGLLLDLARRLSTDSDGVRAAMGLQAEAKVELETILLQLESKISATTLFDFGPMTDVSPMTAPS